MKNIRLIMSLVFLMLLTSPIVGHPQSDMKKSTIAKKRQKVEYCNYFGIKNPDKKSWKGSKKMPSGTYAQFESVPYSIRAVTRILSQYQLKKKKTTIYSIVKYYTQQSDEQIGFYLEHLENNLHTKMNKKIQLFNPDGTIRDYHQLTIFIETIAKCESGKKLKKQDIYQGMFMYEFDYTDQYSFLNIFDNFLGRRCCWRHVGL